MSPASGVACALIVPHIFFGGIKDFWVGVIFPGPYELHAIARSLTRGRPSQCVCVPGCLAFVVERIGLLPSASTTRTNRFVNRSSPNFTPATSPTSCGTFTIVESIARHSVSQFTEPANASFRTLAMFRAARSRINRPLFPAIRTGSAAGPD